LKRIAYLTELLYALLLAPLLHIVRLVGWRPRRVTIVGWWGSETVGDIAILGQLLRELSAICSPQDVCVVSFDASLTRRSLRQLQRGDIEVLPLGIISAIALVASRTVIFGGGPLMESPTMRFWRWTVRIAQFSGARVMLYANGIGPLRTVAATRAVVRIVKDTGFVLLRDRSSQRWALEHAGREDAVLGFDAAFDFVRAALQPGITRRAQIALALRAPPASYLGAGDVAAATQKFVTTVAAALDRVGEQRELRFVGIVMHTGMADSDDHAIYRQLQQQMRHPEWLSVAPGEHSVQQVVRTLQESRAALTVRFHAMIFALGTETPFVAIDYARPDGKVTAVADDIGRGADVLPWDALSTDVLVTRLLAAYDGGPIAIPDVQSGAAARVAVLRAAVGS
jgi:polysaccharide pyruvyl transferase WcaK-like protein